MHVDAGERDAAAPRFRRRSSGTSGRRGAFARPARACRRPRRAPARPRRADDRHAGGREVATERRPARRSAPRFPGRSSIAPSLVTSSRVEDVDRVEVPRLSRGPHDLGAGVLEQARRSASCSAASPAAVRLRRASPAPATRGRPPGAAGGRARACSWAVFTTRAYGGAASGRPRLSRNSLRLPHFGLCTHDGQPSLARAAVEHARRVGDPALELLEAALGDADAAGVAVVDEDRRRARVAGGGSSRGRRCPSGRTSPRAAAARSSRARRRGASPSSFGICVEPVELLAARARTRPPRSRRWSAGRSSGTSSIRSCVADRSSAGSATTCSVTATLAEDELEAEPPLDAQRLARSSVVVSFFTCVYQSPVNGSTIARGAASGRARGRGTARRGGGRRRPRARSSTRARARRAPSTAPVRRVDDGERVGGRRSGAACARPGSPSRPRPSRAACAAARGSAARARAPRRRASRASSSSSGASKAAARTWPSSTRGFAWSRIAASTRRPSSVSGSRMKYWSSASSVATSTARPWPRRPGAAPLLAQARRPCRGSRRRSRSRAGRCRSRARARRSPRRRAARPRRAAARSRAAAAACSRRGTARAASPSSRRRARR